MTPAKEKKPRNGIVDSTVELGAAATKFAIDQVETVLCAVASPTKAMDRLKRSIDNVADAMNAPVEGEEAKEKTGKAHATAAAPPVRQAQPEREEPAEVAEAAEEVVTAAAFTGRKT